MSARIQSLLAVIGVIGISVVVFLIAVSLQSDLGPNVPLEDRKINIAQAPQDTPQTVSAQTSPTTAPQTKPTGSKIKSASIKQSNTIVSATTTDNLEVKRIENPYPFPPLSFAIVNEQARLALVNILCSARTGSLRPISASGVIIDPRGVILTNAHVAQYVLLASDQKIDLSCVVRVGSPAVARFVPEVLYIPPVWVKEHASEIKTARPLGTGEHDYALLRIKETINGLPLPAPPAGGFPYLPLDTREKIGFIDDMVLVASYPAEFIGGMTAQLNLYPVSSITAIKGLLTFSDKGTIDLVSLGGIIGAQSGSSGGAVVNAWGRLIGIISTTSEGATTAERDLHAITLSYINRSIVSESGMDITAILASDVARYAYVFNSSEAPALRKLLIDQIKGH